MNLLKPVDHSALKVNQLTIIVLLLIAFILNAPLLMGLVALFMLSGTLLGQPGFGFLYTRLLKTRGWVKPDVLQDHPEPHRFAQGFGGTVVLAGFVALLAGLPSLGWSLVWLVIFLAALNAFAGFCAGCMVYYWLNRLGLPGFNHAAQPGRFPGLRPKSALEEGLQSRGDQ